jgi:hypothetical protein
LGTHPCNTYFVGLCMTPKRSSMVTFGKLSL